MAVDSPPLKADDLTQAIVEALRREWLAAKGVAPTEAALADCRLMFAAVARGVLEYLKDHEQALLKSITLREESIARVWPVEQVDFNYRKG
ncbi:MAG TPA: hypothetical protein VFU22_08025 [Roseiflexaceae bacterium]|nr:hypothetical protein [Roseiflexaceae bacterium]